MENKHRLKKRKDFTGVYRKGRSFQGKFVVLCYRKTTKTPYRVGFTVSKKVGKAVIRNQVRRRLKEIVRLHPEVFQSGIDYIYVARSIASDASYASLEKEVLSLAKRVK